jgi:hypothetical protein
LKFDLNIPVTRSIQPHEIESNSCIINEIKLLNPTSIEGQFLWSDIATKHHLLLSFLPKLTINKILYQDPIHLFSRIYQVDFHNNHIYIKSFLSFNKEGNNIQLKNITVPAHESWFLERFITREHISFIFNFYSFFDKQCFILPHLSIGSIQNIHHLLKQSNLTLSSIETNDFQFSHSKFIDNTTTTTHLLTNQQSGDSLSPPSFHSYIDKSSGRFIRGNIEPRSNINKNNNK